MVKVRPSWPSSEKHYTRKGIMLRRTKVLNDYQLCCLVLDSQHSRTSDQHLLSSALQAHGNDGSCLWTPPRWWLQGRHGWRGKTPTMTVLLLLAGRDHTKPSHDRCTKQCATHAPQYAANSRHPWGQQNGQRQGMAPHEFCPLVPGHRWHLNLHLRLRCGLLLLHLLHCC
jgi:hypothetical protein